MGIAIACAVLLLELLVRAPGPEDWDGIGFVSSVRTFDLAAFSPHPPGYPVYVALLRVVSWVVGDPALAGAVLSALAAALCAHCTFRLLALRLGPHVAAVGALCGAAPSLLLRSGSQVGTEATALAFLMGAIFFALRQPEAPRPDRDAARRAALLFGLLAGLGLGVRLSWWPLFAGVLVLARPHARIRALASAGVGVLAWAIPLAIVVGPGHLVTLLAAHGEGHAQRFGRTLLHDGDVTGHLAAVARDMVADGLGVDVTALGLAIALLAALGLARFVRLWANGALMPRTSIALALLAYGVFVLLFQNVIESPRHLLPVVYAVGAAAGVAIAVPWQASARGVSVGRALGTALVVLLLLRGMSDARARSIEPPLGAQVVSLARAEPVAPGGLERGEVAIFGGDSARFAIAAGIPGGYAENLGDVTLGLGSMQRLPTSVLVTSEVEVDGRGRALVRVATVCRPPRLDRKHHCLDVYRLNPR